ncbi:phage portal protein, HK97 family [Faunimonas pinastri]|uniref:Phage portal protein, HK97 family n=1 Tax=Faunimonas pinastri TaxID=1855383 RepID=A0A1H9F613_9HYPH|nr:phage portal protein [Faunimonas pinastri]SEQ33380.1 phage portal protein, HK97 family [Faunimonas pinastri]
MGVLDRWRGRSISLTDGAFFQAFFGGGSHAGKAVTNHTALQLSAVWSCIRLTAQAVAGLPMGFYEKQSDGGRVGRDDHPLAEILLDSPNDDQTTVEFWEGMVAWLCTNGNAYAEIATSGERITALQPFDSDKVQPYRTQEGELRYRFIDRGQIEDLPREKMLHLRAFGFGGDVGLSPIRFGVQTMGSAIAADETAAKMFGNGMQVAGVLTSDQVLKDAQRTQLAEVMKQYVGSTNAGKMMILEAGLKYQQLTMNPEDAQLLETRRFNIEEICRWFGVPPIMVGHAGDGQTMWGSGVEQILLGWLTTGLNPMLNRIEQRIRKQLIRPGDRRTLYAEFNREGLLQADSAAKAAFLSTMVQNALMTRNEGRSKLNLPKKPGGDALTAQTNLAPLDQLGSLQGNEAAKAAFRAWLGIDDKERQHAA